MYMNFFLCDISHKRRNEIHKKAQRFLLHTILYVMWLPLHNINRGMVWRSFMHTCILYLCKQNAGVFLGQDLQK